VCRRNAKCECDDAINTSASSLLRNGFCNAHSNRKAALLSGKPWMHYYVLI
jgi:hypothetical protein